MAGGICCHALSCKHVSTYVMNIADLSCCTVSSFTWLYVYKSILMVSPKSPRDRAGLMLMPSDRLPGGGGGADVLVAGGGGDSARGEREAPVSSGGSPAAGAILPSAPLDMGAWLTAAVCILVAFAAGKFNCCYRHRLAAS